MAKITDEQMRAYITQNFADYLTTFQEDLREEKGKEIDFCFPCGMCRQFMAEFCKKDFQIIVAKSPDDFKLYNMGMLLPETFFIG